MTEVTGTLRSAHEQLRTAIGKAAPPPPAVPETAPPQRRAMRSSRPSRPTGCAPSTSSCWQCRQGFTINAKLAKQLERRHEMIEEGGIDWGQGEALAYASLLEDGIPVRLSGQDAERGTFAHRHLVFHDPYSGETYAPIQHLPEANASFEVYNSPLSEYAALGFEYGYSVAAPDALVLWEAQFGDFVNGAQIVIDQFLVAGRSKWGQTSRLTLLLPHGYEGNGPEHSSARLERFLQQGAQDNIRIANCTTAGQFFHLLRRQALDATARPLVVMTPKGLLRLKQAASTIEDLSTGSFRPVIPDPIAGPDVRRLVLCSGKVYYDIVGHSARPGCDGRRDRAAGAALPVPGRGARRVARRAAAARGDRLGPGGAAEHGCVALDPPPARRRRPRELAGGGRHLHRPLVARVAERGVSDRPSDRAGPHRAGRSRRRRGLISALRRAARRGGRGRSHLRPVRPCRLEQKSALCRGKLAPHAVREEARSHRICRAASVASAPMVADVDRSLSTRCCTFRRFRPLRSGMASDRVAPDPVPEPGGSMPVETASELVASPFASVIQDHLELKKQNAELDGEMPLDHYQIEDPFENHPLFKSEEQARIEETLDGEPAIELHSLALPWPGEDTAETAAPEGPALDGDLWGRSRDFDWGE